MPDLRGSEYLCPDERVKVDPIQRASLGDSRDASGVAMIQPTVSAGIKEAMTMTTIKATCPTCGDIDLKPREVQVVVAPSAGWATYAFTCPTCENQVTKTADDEVVTLLRGAGVTVERVVVPAEALELHYGPGISNDDLIDFGLTLGNSDYLVAQLTREGQRTGD